MLSLTSTKWELLDGPYGNGGHIPLQIQQLQQDYDQEQATALYYEELYHQNTIYPCTYVTVPYLVELALHTSEHYILTDIYIVCGMFEAWNQLPLSSYDEDVVDAWRSYFVDFDENEVKDIYQSYTDSLMQLQQRMTELIIQIDQVEESEKMYILSATAALHGYRQWAKCLLMYSDGEEYILDCSHCDQPIYIWPVNDSNITEWRAYSEDPVIQTGATFEKVIPDLEYAHQIDLNWLYTYMGSLQMSSWLAQLPYLGGRVKCPHCSDDICVKEQLLQQFS
ncbi:hypothetical protein PQ456_12690 [Paenibacillus kyungheensis]|uniref:Uncharacterized protein n=1 Tax=Paenibacillus kyungheensis TaxID=1452732 RepID=A0AAX3LWI3_9BACL|nr:hypothetical protein [Paenibacillus kyungheensis]WCT54063.1 hypothetical protein PQ456_12690 [Paenibacillus kyungheensis]